MQIKMYSGDLPTGRRRGRAPDEISQALMNALDVAVETGKPQVVSDLEGDREINNLSTRLRLLGKKKALSVSIMTLDDRTGFVFTAEPTNGTAPPSPSTVTTTATEEPKRTSRKARK